MRIQFARTMTRPNSKRVYQRWEITDRFRRKMGWEVREVQTEDMLKTRQVKIQNWLGRQVGLGWVEISKRLNRFRQRIC